MDLTNVKVVPVRITILIYLTIKERTYSTYPKILSHLNINKEAGMDHSCKIFERSCSVFPYPLCKFINLFVNLSIFLEECKIGRLNPLIKTDFKTDPKSYRPISLLPIMSKIIEKSIYTLQNNLNKNWPSLQISFRFYHKLFYWFMSGIINRFCFTRQEKENAYLKLILWGYEE